MASKSSDTEKDLYASVEELRLKLETMKTMMAIENEDSDDDEEASNQRRKKGRYKESIIDGSFLSFVFVLVLLLIICVSVYAFSNLYFAVLKKFPARKHNEL